MRSLSHHIIIAWPESGNHLFIECRLIRHIWTKLVAWLAIPDLHPTNWELAHSFHTWWSAMTMSYDNRGVTSGPRPLIMLMWRFEKEIWTERNARVYSSTWRRLLMSSLIRSRTKHRYGLWSEWKPLAKLVGGQWWRVAEFCWNLRGYVNFFS